MLENLYQHQQTAVRQMHDGCILVAEVGLGKSRTALAYYILNHPNESLYIITTAKKRDSKEWDEELAVFNIENCVVDSWNNIKKYTEVKDAFFIFDEQRVVGCGAWVKSFYKIAKKNKWILLTATPGDTWADYIPVFVANGFYRNKTDFNSQHVVFKPFMKYPVIDRYVDTGILIRQRNQILVVMKKEKQAVKVKEDIIVDFDRFLYRKVFRDRWNIYEDEPILETGKLCYLLRRVVNSDPSRARVVKELLEKHSKAIIFYNFTYELNILRELATNLGFEIGEWNGEKHTDVPTGDRWVYLCQYTAAAEGWNCITTNVIIFYSQNYSYRTTVQSAGRIDRINTPFTELYYYTLRSVAPIDLAIRRALSNKQNFNERTFLESR